MAETPNLEKVAKRGKKSEVSKSGTKKSQKNEENNSEEYYCKYCDYFTLNKSNYAKHINTRKHQTKQKMALLELNGTLDDTENEKTDDCKLYECDICWQIFKSKSSYYRDKKLCYMELTADKRVKKKNLCIGTTKSENKLHDNQCDIVEYPKKSSVVRQKSLKITEENAHIHEFYHDIIEKKESMYNDIIEQKDNLYDVMIKHKDEVIEGKDEIIDMSKGVINMTKDIIEKGGVGGGNMTNSHNTTNTNCGNFNLQLFLNNDCKDAINMTEFIENLKIQLSDLEATGTLGYVEGISKMIINNLQEMDVTKRPIHCSDPKRDTMYIKENDVWEKDTSTNKNMMKAIDNISKNTVKQIPEWVAENSPECNTMGAKNDMYMNILANNINQSKDENEKNAKRVIKKVAKEVIIDKPET